MAVTEKYDERQGHTRREIYTAIQAMTAAVCIVNAVYFCADEDELELINDSDAVDDFLKGLASNCGQNMRENAITMLTRTLRTWRTLEES